MRAVIQRVKEAQVQVNQAQVGAIQKGVLVFLGVAKADTSKDADFLIQKIFHLRMFEDQEGKMNLSAADANGAFLVVSQFTIMGNCDKGRRPSFDDAADPKIAEELYNYFVENLRAAGAKVEEGQFQAMMDVQLINDGPVTFIIESKK